MSWDFQQIKQTLREDAAAVASPRELEDFRIKYLGRKGLIQEIYASLADAPKDQKPIIGKEANDLKKMATALVEERKQGIGSQPGKAQRQLDPTLPGVAPRVGHKHLLTQTIEEICDIFEGLGFSIQEGPEVETEFNNFTALNIPEDHPSRDGFDTFYTNVKDRTSKDANLLLRSHTSRDRSASCRSTRLRWRSLFPARSTGRMPWMPATHSCFIRSKVCSSTRTSSFRI